ncbi:hypothetical protein F5I97DRAFT_965007 [Phlebopus sp. FC_14]|nr:hypothetical protein F5I97DRAFT_965007 [Phlebopus sp. FC_14]
MAPAGAKPTRKRNRKRKRRIASDSSSSSDDSSSSEDSVAQKPTAPLNPAKRATVPLDDSETSSSPSSSSSDDSSDSEDEPTSKLKPPSTFVKESSNLTSSQRDGQTRDSPSPLATASIRPFISPDSPESERALKEKFRKFWMASLAEGFKDDLQEIRKQEPNLGPSRLALLVESLAAGADVFSSNSKDGGVNEMEVVMDEIS